jgi:hypothetical protein
MTQRLAPPSPETRAWLKELSEQKMPESEFLALVDAPMADEERQDIHDLVDWFMRRYPTPGRRHRRR